MLIDFVKQEQSQEFGVSQGLYAGLMGQKTQRKTKGNRTRGISGMRKRKKSKKTVQEDPIPKHVLKFQDELFKLFSKYAVFKNKEPKLNNFKFIKLLQDASIVKITSRLEKIKRSPKRKSNQTEECKSKVLSNN